MLSRTGAQTHVSGGQAASIIAKSPASAPSALRRDRSGILARYVLVETVRVFLLAAAGLTGVIFVGMAVQLIHSGLNVVQLRAIVPFMLLYALPYGVPIGLLIAVVLTFGRLAGDNEITAIRGSGVPLRAIVMPAVWLSSVVTVGALALSLHLLPWAHRRVRELRNVAIQPYLDTLGTVRSSLKILPYEIHVDRAASRGAKWRNVAVVRYAQDYVAEVVIAKSASCSVRRKTNHADIVLHECDIYRPIMRAGAGHRFAHAEEMRVSIDLSKQAAGHLHRPKFKPLWELLADRADLAKRLRGYPTIARPAKARKDLQRKYNRLVREKSDQSLKVAAARANAASAKEDLRAHRAQIRALEEELKRADDRIRQLDRDIKHAKADLAEFNKKDRTRLSRDEKERKRDLGQKLTALSEARRRAESVRGNKLDEVNQLKNDVAPREKKRDAAQARHNTLKREAGKQEAERAELDQRLTRASWQVRSLETESELHSRFSGAVASLVCVLIGLPLGILAKHGNVMVALGLSFGVILVLYYPLHATAQMAAEHGMVAPGLALWTPNVVLALLGLWLMRKVMRV